jgi:hypothetical protein
VLSPGYLDFMVKSVGMILSGSAFQPLNPVESNQLVMVSLYMKVDREARELFLQDLSVYGVYVNNCWRAVYDAVTENNSRGQQVALDQVHALLKRIKEQ